MRRSVVWLTPPRIIEQLGGWRNFDLDPCAAPEPRPWPTALHMNALEDGDGLMLDWYGRVLLNPPFKVSEIRKWGAKMAAHGRGSAIYPASTGSRLFRRSVWPVAAGIMFLYGRIAFFRPDGSVGEEGSGAPSVIVAYGQDDLDRLMSADLDGEAFPLRFARFMLISGLDRTWGEIIGNWLREQSGPVSVADAYRFVADHPKARGNPNYRAKVRQKLRELGERIGPATYQARAA